MYSLPIRPFITPAVCNDGSFRKAKFGTTAIKGIFNSIVGRIEGSNLTNALILWFYTPYNDPKFI